MLNNRQQNMDDNVQKILAAMEEQQISETDRANNLHKIKEICNNVVDFLNDAHITTAATLKTNTAMEIAAGVAMEAETFASTSLFQLAKECGVPSNCLTIAVEELLYNLDREFSEHGSSPSLMLSNRGYNPHGIVDMSAVLPDAISSIQNVVPSMESFGIDSDKVVTDIRMTMAITLMKFSKSIVLRTFATQVLAQPAIQFKVSHIETFDMNNKAVINSYTDLMNDPSLARNELSKINVLKANDASGDAAVLVADGVIKSGSLANILNLSLDATKIGTTKVDQTDLVSDGVFIDGVIVQLADGTNTEQFLLPLHRNEAPLVRFAGAKSSMERKLVNSSVKIVDSTTAQTSGAASAALAAFTGVNKVRISLDLSSVIDLRLGDMRSTISGSLDAFTTDGTAVSTGAATQIDLMSVTIIGYTIDARRSEENLRASTRIVRETTSHVYVPVPPPAHYLTDVTFDQQITDSMLSNLNQVMRIGQDDKSISTVAATVNYLIDQINMIKNGTGSYNDLGKNFAAGGKVRPAVYSGNIDFADLNSIKDSDLASDVRSRTMTMVAQIIERLTATSYYAQQLPGGKRIWRMITSNEVAGNCFGPNPIHTTFPNTQFGDSDGIEYRIELNNSIILEIVTCTFADMSRKAYFAPFVPNAASVINGFQHYVHGTSVGRTNMSGDNASFVRMNGAVRECTIPTCPVMAVLDFVNMDTIVNLNG